MEKQRDRKRDRDRQMQRQTNLETDTNPERQRGWEGLALPPSPKLSSSAFVFLLSKTSDILRKQESLCCLLFAQKRNTRLHTPPRAAVTSWLIRTLFQEDFQLRESVSQSPSPSP